MNTPLLTVVLCAHNPGNTSINRVLTGLAQQTLSAESWELVLVDNASVPPLAERELPLPSNARVIVERELGLTPARLAGFASARALLLVLMDDDTVPDHDYLEACLQFMKDHPEVGAAGGRIRGEFATPPKAWMNGYLDLLALRDFGDRPIRALIHNEVGPWEPCGAGMVVRAEVVREYAGRVNQGRHRSLDRVGSSLSSCGDTDLARTAPDLNLYLAYEPRLRLTHLIPPSRLTLGYMTRLVFSVQRDGWLLFRLRGKSCRVFGWRLWAHFILAPIRSVSIDPRRWLLKAASNYGQLRGRALELEVHEDE